MENISTKLCLLTPSYIDSEERLDYASDSYMSLVDALDFNKLRHFVVDDSDPIYLDYLRRSEHKNKLVNLYSAGAPTLVYRKKPLGSATAMLEAVNLALAEGFKLGFIHLDDQIYNAEFHTLLSSACVAMRSDDQIAWLRFSGYPLIHGGSQKFSIDNDIIDIEGIPFTPSRSRKFTTWLSSFESTKKADAKNYWPVAMWHSLYRLDVLKVMLERGLSLLGGFYTLKRRIMRQSMHLCHIELTYKSRFGFNSLIQNYPTGKYGYVNMQFGGIEIHRNKNWEELMKLNNEPVL